MNKLLKSSFIRYAMVGAAGFAIDYAVFLAVYSALGGHAFSEGLANCCGMLAGAVWCYLLNRTWSFKSKGRMTAEAARYAALFAFNTVASSLLLRAASGLLSIDARLVKIPLMGLVFIWNFTVSRFWVFRK